MIVHLHYLSLLVNKLETNLNNTAINMTDIPILGWLSSIGNVWENAQAASTESANSLIFTGVGDL